MSVYAGPEIADSGLVFAMDVANPNCINASGCIGYNTAPQIIKNLINPSESVSSSSTLRLGNLTYFTAFAIDYPESSYGGAAASRDGITPGFNVTSGTKDFDFGRALNFWIYDSDTSTTVKSTVYDTYAYSSEVDRFVTEYYQAKNLYQGNRYTYLVSGSHRDSIHSDAEYTALKDMGAPSNVGSVINNSAPEWILVGRPGIGVGNGAWVYQNYTTNPDQVAHMNFGVPFKGNSANYLSFNGSSDYINANWSGVNTSAGGYNTVSMWVYWTGGTNGFPMEFSSGYRLWMPSGRWGFNNGSGDCYGIDFNIHVNTWKYVTSVFYNGAYTGNNKIYVNGVQQSLSQLNGSGTSGTASTSGTIGNYGGSIGAYPFPGRISSLTIHNRELSASEIQQNFQAIRGRYGI